MELITVYTAFNPADALLVRSRLEAASFHPNIVNEASTTFLGGYSKSTLIRVEVPETEAGDARDFLTLGTDAPAE
jgi:hypothetical protein